MEPMLGVRLSLPLDWGVNGRHRTICDHHSSDHSTFDTPPSPSILPCVLQPICLPPRKQVNGQRVVVKVQRPGLKELFLTFIFSTLAVPFYGSMHAASHRACR